MSELNDQEVIAVTKSIKGKPNIKMIRLFLILFSICHFDGVMMYSFPLFTIHIMLYTRLKN